MAKMRKIRVVKVLEPHIREVEEEHEDEEEREEKETEVSNESELERDVEAAEPAREDSEVPAALLITALPALQTLVSQTPTQAVGGATEEAREGREVGAAGTTGAGEVSGAGVQYGVTPYLEAERLSRGHLRVQQAYLEQDIESQAVEIRREPVRPVQQMQEPRMRAPLTLPLASERIRSPFDERVMELPREHPLSQPENPEQKYQYQQKVGGAGERRRRDLF